MPVLARLKQDVWWALAFALVLYSLSQTYRFSGPGWDAHAYWMAWRGSMYGIPPGYRDAYNYSPVFAQVLWPLAQLPWPVFCGILVATAGAGVAWLVRPLPGRLPIAVWLCASPEILSGNIYWLLAIVAVVGFRHPGAWTISALTKITPTLGPLWFLIRREWRSLTIAIVSAVVVTAISAMLAPHLWQEWISFLLRNHERGWDGIVPPPIYRLPVGLILTVYAARTDRRWILPIAMGLVTPVFGMGTFAILTALPRLLRFNEKEEARGAEEHQNPHTGE